MDMDFFMKEENLSTIKKTRTLTFELNEIKDPKDHKEAVSGDGYSYNYVSVGQIK